MRRPEIFKAYDIRGIVGKTLTPAIVRAIGQGARHARPRARPRHDRHRPRRPSVGSELVAALSRRHPRVPASNVIDLGMVATPMTYFAAQHLGTGCSVMVTGSHNPPDYNGLKMVIAGDTLSGDDIQALRQRIESGDASRRAAGSYRTSDIAPGLSRPHRRRRQARAAAEDCRSIAATASRGAFAPELYPRLGCDVVRAVLRSRRPLSESPSRPVAARRTSPDLIARARARASCELGLAFDGDGDRLGVVTRDGHVIYPDRQLMLFAADVLSAQSRRDVIYDVKSTRNLKPWIIAPRRRAAALEDRALADQGQDEGSRCGARRAR